MSDLATGEEPAILWADGTTLHSPDGTTVRVSGVATIDDLARMREGFVVTTVDDTGNQEAVLVTSDGTVAERYPLQGGLAISPEGGVVAFADDSGAVTAIQSDGAQVVPLPPIPGDGPYDAAAVTSEDCTTEPGGGEGCLVLVNLTGRRPALAATGSHGATDEVGGGIRTLTAHRASYAGITVVRDDLTTCSELQPRLGVTRWRTCAYRLLGFSPDTAHLVAAGSVGDGDGVLAILRADGTPVVDLRSSATARTTSLQAVWEDGSHVLTVTHQDGTWAVVRVGVDRSMEYAVPPVAGPDTGRPFVLQTR